MKKAFLPEITYMRGLCMLGVIGIHVGSYALQNPFVNLELISVLEILSRFGVPAFFFLSAFGLFYHTSVEGPFSYKEFMHRRIQVVLFPYITWSIFYLLYTGLTAHNLGNLHPGPLAVNLLFGTIYVSFILYGYPLMVLRDDASMASYGESHLKNALYFGWFYYLSSKLASIMFRLTCSAVG